ncbi:DNA-directed RNA polymerase [Thermoplasmatales archaeon ex4484_6]|nr:MAG: DNA-directed RNA polymerase [Thermoplasmatales archaeon ex4484_6]RLF67393.1 MAG: DNA-directed RNA polymerase [Thermoplasmata archaeon]
MYKMIQREDVIRIPPHYLGQDLDVVAEYLTRKNFEGRMDSLNRLVIEATDVKRMGDGKIVHGDGAIFQKVNFKALVFQPLLHEVVEGNVVEILKFGAFVRFGPLDGLIHISQVMDDHIDVDLGNMRLLGKDSKRDLKVGDRVRARIVSMSMNERSPRESRIGLTMRQAGLGKIDWLDEEYAERHQPEEEVAPKKKKK